MKRSTLRVLLTRAGRCAPRGYFAGRTGPDYNVRVALRPTITPSLRDAAIYAARCARMVRP